MAYKIFTDSSSNLPYSVIVDNGLTVIPLKFEMNGEEYAVDSKSADIERKAFFAAMRIKVEVKTSLVNFGTFLEEFEKVLKTGDDILFVGMSSGISGTFNNAVIAAGEALEKYPDRKIELVDTLNASLGEGLIVMEAIKMQKAGDSLEAAAEKLRAKVPHIRGHFMVDDIMFLHRTGRVSGVVAVAGKALGIRPLLKGDDTGHIVMFGKARGRKAALKTLMQEFDEHIIPNSHQTVAVAHCDAPEEAELVAAHFRKNPAVDDVIIEWYENVTGSHLGPGAVATFYFADKR